MKFDVDSLTDSYLFLSNFGSKIHLNRCLSDRIAELLKWILMYIRNKEN